MEGIVLLENDGCLPVNPKINHGKLALYGAGAKMTIKGGTGSGEVNERHVVSILEGMEHAGFKITTMDWIDDYDQSFQEGERAYAEEFRKKLSPKNSVRFYESDEQSIPLSIWKSSATGRCRKIRDRYLYLRHFQTGRRRRRP
ncbi:MAG: glycoside hydrolase family 3 C-terminal domain-containing protein [Dorea longicatena]